MTWTKRGILALLVAGALGFASWQWSQVAPRANAAEKAPAKPSNVVRAEGRVATRPGALVTIGVDFVGTVRKVGVNEKDHVKKGDLLAEIAADETRAQVAEANARVREAEVDIAFLDTEAQRAERLLASNAVARDLFDRASHDRDAAKARRTSALATATRLGATLAKSRVVAPIGGVVLARHVEPGQVVSPGAAIATVADLTQLRIEAEVDEFDTSRVAVGAPVVIHAEGWNETWPGKVEEIPDEVGGRKLRPQDPGKPSDTRVLAVKIAFDAPSTKLLLGQRVEVEISR